MENTEQAVLRVKLKMLSLFKEKPKSRIGLEISPEGVTMALLTKEKNSVSINDEIYKPLEDSGSIQETIKAIIRESRPDDLNVAISVPSNTVFIKRIKLPDLPMEELRAIAPQEASKYLPLAMSEMIVDFQILESTRKQDETGAKIDVVLCAVAKSLAKEYINPIIDAGLGIDMLDISSFATIRTLAYEELINEPQKVYISVLIGYENTDINIIQNGMPVFSYNVNTGRKNLIDSIMHSIHRKKEEVINMLPEIALVIPGAEMHENPELNQAAIAAKGIYSNISGEIQKTMEFFNSGNAEPVEIERIIISGCGACVENIDKYISGKLRIEAVTYNPLFSTSIGLALKGLEN